MDKALVTGGAGFVGRHLVSRLLDSGVSVNILDDFSSGVREGTPTGANIFEGDIRDTAILSSAARTHIMAPEDDSPALRVVGATGGGGGGEGRSPLRINLLNERDVTF